MHPQLQPSFASHGTTLTAIDALRKIVEHQFGGEEADAAEKLYSCDGNDYKCNSKTFKMAIAIVM
eukprot:2312923-Amphidinium_carterae.1